MVEIIKLDKNLVIIYKHAGTPSQPDPSGDPDAMTEAAELLASRGEDSRLWLVHRLDRTVSGLLVFARNGRAAAELSRISADGSMGKLYLAVVEGVPEDGLYTDYLYKDARLSKAFVTDRSRRGVKLAELECTKISSKGNKSLCRVRLHTGRYHQIRVQLASRKCPIVGDGKYGSRDKGARMPALTAYRLDFILFGKHYSAVRLPGAHEYPWCEFANEIDGERLIYD